MTDRKVPRALFCLALVVLLVGVFQNCAKVGFQAPEDSFFFSSLSAPELEIEGGRSATNKKLLQVRITGLGASSMDQMRVANAKDLVNGEIPASVPWKPYQETFQFDLGDDFASNGSKDTVKTLVVQVKPKVDIPSDRWPRPEGRILLDTVPPKIDMTGILKTGLNGVVYKKDDSVDLEWSASDPAASTGKSSGLHPQEAIQLGWANSEDCSKVLPANMGIALPESASAHQFRWPMDTRLEAFFICVFVQDAAGNKTTGLSQPMTHIWQVIAGDNNQGNGGSWKASNVRFGAPRLLAADSKDNLLIFDTDYMTIRKVTPDGAISTFIGNGLGGTPTPADRLSSPLPSPGFLALDSSDRIYTGSGSLWRLRINDSSRSFQSENLIGSAGIMTATVHRFADGVEYLLFASYESNSTDFMNSYVYKVPLSFFEGKTLPLPKSAFDAFRVVGGGKVVHYKAGEVIAREQTAASAVMPLVRALKVDSNDDIYVGGTADGSNWGWGEHCVLMARGTKLYKLVSSKAEIAWANQMEIAKLADGRRMLFVGGHYRRSAVTLNLQTLPLTADLPVQVISPAADPSSLNETSYGLALMRQTVAGEPVLYGGDQTMSRIHKYQGLKIVDTFGRPIYNASDKQALTSMVAAPSGITEDKDGNIYFFEALTGIVRKLNRAGELSVFAGTPGVVGNSADQDGKTLTSAQFHAESFQSGYRFPLAYDQAHDQVVLGLGSIGRVHLLPRAEGAKVASLHPAAAPSATIGASESAPKDKNTWPIYDLVMRGNDLLVSRTLTVFPFRTQIMSYSLSGNSAMTPFVGNELGDNSLNVVGGATQALTGAANAVSLTYVQPVAVLNGQVYFSHKASLLSTDGASVGQVAAGLSYQNFDMAKDSTGRLFAFTLIGNNLYSQVINTNGTVQNFNLCLPGSFVNGTYVKMSRDGNSLLVGDTKLQRVLRYNVKDNGKFILFQKTSSGSCQQVLLQ